MSDLAQYTDSAGTDWVLAFTITKTRALKQIGLNFPDLQTGQTYLDLITDDLLFTDVLWLLCSEAAATRNIDRDAFEAALDGDAMSKAEVAFKQAVVNFTRAPLRNVVERNLDSSLKARDAIMDAAREAMESDETATLIETMRSEALAEMKRDMSSGASLQSFRESLEATPENSRSAS